MHIFRDFAVSLDVTNPLSICIDYEENIIKLLRKEYKDRCYQNCLIKDITQLIQYTPPMMSRSTLECVANINVIFQASCYIISKGDVLVNTKIITITPGDIVIVAPNIKCSLKMNPYLSSFKVGSIIPIIINAVNYEVNSSQITVLGAPFLFKKYTRLVNNQVNLDHESYQKLIACVNEIRAKIDMSKVNKYIRLIMLGIKPGETEPEALPVIQSNIVFDSNKIDQFAASITNKVITTNYYNDKLDLSMVAAEYRLDLKVPVVDVDTYIKYTIGEYLTFLRGLYEFMETFDQTKINESMNLWNLYYAIRVKK